MTLTDYYRESALIGDLRHALEKKQARIHVDGMTGSLPSIAVATLSETLPDVNQLVIVPSKEEAFYFANDLEALLGENKVMLFPTSYRKAYHYNAEETENANIIMRSEVVKTLSGGTTAIVVSYPDALSEKVVSSNTFSRHTLHLSKGMKQDMWNLVDRLQELGFEREDFVVEPGQFALRGGIVDLFSFASDLPYRIEFFDDEIDSLRTYDPVTQLSVKQLDRVDVVPNFAGVQGSEEEKQERKVSILEYFSDNDIVWVQSLMMVTEQIERQMELTRKEYNERLTDTAHPIAGTLPPPTSSCTSCLTPRLWNTATATTSAKPRASPPRASPSRHSTSSSTCSPPTSPTMPSTATRSSSP